MQWKKRNGQLAPQDIVDAIDYGCRSAGTPRGIVCAIIEIESNFRLNALNPTTKAAGLLQIKPEYLADYRRYAGVAFDPMSIGAAIAGGEIMDTLANLGRSRGFAGNAALQYAIAAHRWGTSSQEAKTPQDNARVLEVESMMRANGMWYDTPQPAPETPVLIQLPMPQNPCHRQGKALATAGGKAAGFMIHANGVQYVPAWHWPIRWNVPSSEKAVHFHLDSHGIIQALRHDKQGWHAGGSANSTWLGVELSEPYTDSPAAFNAALKNLKWLVVKMKQAHGFAVGNIIGHYEGHQRGIASNHGDPANDPGYVHSTKAPWRDPDKRGQGYFTRNGYSMARLREDIARETGGGGGQPPPPANDPTIFGEGARGSRVKLVQAALNQRLGGEDLKLDGVFGPKTKAAMSAFQRSAGFTATGSLTQNTVRKLMPTLRRGAAGAVVRAMQELLAALGHNPGGIDGQFGPLTEAAIMRFQRTKKLEADGIVGPQTWLGLLG